MTNFKKNGGLDTCTTPGAIERYFQRGIDERPFGRHDKLRSACNERAVEIAPHCTRGHLLAIRTDKRSGNSARYRVGGEEYKTGTWGNDAGYRWTMAGFEKWYAGLLRAGGLRSEEKIGLIIEWARSDYLWRCLQHLAS